MLSQLSSLLRSFPGSSPQATRIVLGATSSFILIDEATGATAGAGMINLITPLTFSTQRSPNRLDDSPQLHPVA